MTENRNIYVGIDLGTTFSSISYYDEQKKDVVIIKIDGQESIPSWISLSEKKNGGGVVVGKAAKNEVTTDYVCYDAKRVIGLKYNHENINMDKDNWPFKITPVDENNEDSDAIINISNPANPNSKHEPFYPEEISAMILKYLKSKLEDVIINPKYEGLVVTVPAGFGDLERKATRYAIELAGFELENQNNIMLLNEPSAAVIEYQRVFGKELKIGSKVLVVDFGGGTLDISCCRIDGEDTITVVRNSGDNHLGGNEFDTAMMELIKERLIEDGYLEDEDFNVDEQDEIFMEDITKLEENKRRIAKLKKIAEQAKIELSTKNDVSLEVMNITGDSDHEDMTIEISRADFEDKCRDEGLFSRFVQNLKKVTGAAGFKKNNTDLILLIGGTCRIPKVRQEIFKLFDQNKVAPSTFDGMTAVCKGACFRSFGSSTNIASIIEKIPEPIGLEVNGTQFQKMIDVDQNLPAHAERVFFTTRDNQPSARFAIYSGFSSSTEVMGMKFHNRLLIDNLPQGRRGEVKFNVIMDVAENGIVTVDVKLVGGESNDNNQLQVTMQTQKTSEHVKN